MIIVKTTARGQLQIPEALRKKYHLTGGTELEIYDRNGEIVLKPLNNDFIKSIRGILKDGPSALSFLVEDRTEESAE
jgi:AbrB family looped-hinge helix DNA binding protein